MYSFQPGRSRQWPDSLHKKDCLEGTKRKRKDSSSSDEDWKPGRPVISSPEKLVTDIRRSDRDRTPASYYNYVVHKGTEPTSPKLKLGSGMREDTKLGMHHYSAEACQIPQLPHLTIDTMTQVQLQDFIPYLLKIVRGKTANLASKDVCPEWWPSDIPWSATRTDIQEQEMALTEMLRNVVKSCYKHLGQETSLRPQVNTRSSISQNHPVLQSYLKHSTRGKPGQKSGDKPYAEIYICFFCEKEFMDRDKMRNHQERCSERPVNIRQVITPPRVVPLRQTVRPYPRLLLGDRSTRTTKDVFVKLVNLVPQQKAEKIRARHRYSQEIDCEKIDLDEPMSPTTPRTPKSLISQLSRDDSVSMSKKRLSYSEVVDASDGESVASGSCEDGEGAGGKGKSLLSIDLSSLLGQRVQKHIHAETGLLVLHNAEQFCKKTPVKNDTLGKLRHRVATFPITYRPRKKSLRGYSHQYKFNNRQKREHRRHVRTGLNRSSHELLKSLHPCSVPVDRLTDEDLQQWLSRFVYNKLKGIKPSPSEEMGVFPQEPLLMSKDVDRLLGLKRRSESRTPPLSLANVVSEHVNAEVSKQKLTLYRCLLSDISAYSAFYGGKSLPVKATILKGSKKLIVSDKGKQSNLKSSKAAKNTRGFALPETPLPTFTSTLDLPMDCKSWSDDDISIISMSSDEESLKSSCCGGCRRRKLCARTPEPVIGSLSHSPMSPPMMDCKVKLTKTVTVPVSMPLQINPYTSPSSLMRSPDLSPCSCLSSPGSDFEVGQRIYPSPPYSSKHIGSGSHCNTLTVKEAPSMIKSSGSPQSEIRRTRATAAFTDNVSKLESLLTASRTEKAGSSRSLRNKYVCPDIILTPSPPSPDSPKDDPQYASPTKVTPPNVEPLSLSSQRQILRALRSESLGVSLHTQYDSPKKLSGVPSFRVDVSYPKKSLIASLSLPSPQKSSPSKYMEPTRRSKRILSGSPSSSPAKLCKLDTC